MELAGDSPGLGDRVAIASKNIAHAITHVDVEGNSVAVTRAGRNLV